MRLAALFDDRPDHLRRKILTVAALLVTGNILAWLWAVSAFRNYPVLLGTAALAYGLGLRHAFDADHIAAIDNVTRKLVAEGRRPVSAGLFFSLGHSTVVVALSLLLAGATSALQARFEGLRAVGGLLGTGVSVLFLFGIAGANVVVLVSVWRAFKDMRAGRRVTQDDLDRVMVGAGPLSRLLRGLFTAVRASWHMYPLGLLFGLGFDTATEIGLLGISAAQASQGLPVWSIMVFPALFTAGMTLLDTADSILMLGAYRWATVQPIRKLYYNLTITAVSVVVAVAVGGLEALNLLGDTLGLADGGGFWGAVGALNDDFGLRGLAIVGLFAAAWLVASLVYRLRGYDRAEAAAG